MTKGDLCDLILFSVVENIFWGYEYSRSCEGCRYIGKTWQRSDIGQGAIFYSEKNFTGRAIAHCSSVKNVTEWLKLSSEQAKEYIQKIESERKDFIKKYFKADIDDLENNDLVINLEKLSIEIAIETVNAALKSS